MHFTSGFDAVGVCRHAVEAYTRMVTPLGFGACHVTRSHSQPSVWFTELHWSVG
jgi:hypothetical protein